MPDVVKMLERDLSKEWDRHKAGILHVLDDLKKMKLEVDVTAELDVGVVKLTMEFKVDSSTATSAPPGK